MKHVCLHIYHSNKQSGQIAESGSQTRLPDAAVLPTMLYGCNVLNLNLKLEFNPNLTITEWFLSWKQLLERKSSINSQMQQ